MIQIFNGDDSTDFYVDLQTSAQNLTNYKAELIVGPFVYRWENMTSRRLDFSVSAEQSKTLGLGVHFASIVLISPNGKRHTFTNTFRIGVTDVVQDVSENASGVATFHLNDFAQSLAGETFDKDASDNGIIEFIAKIARKMGADVSPSVG